MRQIEVICGIPEDTISTGLVERIYQMALEKEMKFVIHPCLSKQEVEYKTFSMDNCENTVILLQENMDTSASYQSWEIAALRDIKRIPVVVSVDRKHYGTDYMAVLYAAGIMDAVYEEDANAEELTNRILSRRSRKESREYYGIRSMDEVVSVLDIIGKDVLERYIHYIGAGIDAQDTQLRYQEVRNKLSYVENCCLAEHLPENTIQELQADEEFALYQKTMQKKKKGKEKNMGTGHLMAGLKWDLERKRRKYLVNKKQIKGNEDRIALIMEEIEKLSAHIKTYSVGSYPVFYLQLHSILKVQDIIEMRLSDVYECVHGNVYVKDQIICDEKEVDLSGEDRKNLAWYAMQRIKVRNTEEEQMKKMYLCVNKQGKPLKKQVYRKMLERSSSELDLSRVYNSGYLRSLYGYLEIAYGRKTIDDIATEYQVERYYLLNRIFKGMSIEYDSQLLNEVANIDGDDL